MRKYLIITACCFLSIYTSYGQEVDLVRLAYLKTDITAEQIGMAASPDGKFIGFVYSDKTIKIFDVVAGKFTKRFTGPYENLFDIYLTSLGTIALVGEKEVHLWDWKKEQVIATFSLTERATKTAFLASKNLLAVGQKEGITSVFDLTAKKLIRDITIKKDHVGALAIHPNGQQIAVGVIGAFAFSARYLSLLDIATGEENAKSKDVGYFTMAAFNETGSELMVSGLNSSAAKSILMVLDGKDLSLKRKFGSEVNLTNSKIPYGALFQANRLFALTLSQSFNVNEAQSGTMIFTTKSDKMKIPQFSRLGVGSFNVFPLQGKSGKVMLNAGKNNINQVYDPESNAIAGYFFSDSNDDFAIVSRDGRVDGTPEALSKLYWTAKNSATKTSLESTFDKQFSPRLLTTILSENTSNQVAFEVDKVVGKIPVLSLKSVNGTTPTGDIAGFSSTQKNSKIEIEVKQNLSEVVDVRLYQNAKLIKILPNAGSTKFSFEALLTTSFGEENYFYASATGKAGIESEKLKFTVMYKGANTEKPSLYLITIGINKYKNPKYNLNYAEADADGVEAGLKERSASLFKQIVPYSIRNDKGTKANIVKAFDDVRSKALEQDVLIVYYAGHGVMSEGTLKEKDFFIVPYDVTQLYGKDEMLFEKAISAEEMKKYAQNINAQKQIFILDACQSGGALQSVAARGAMEEKAIAQMARSTGTFWITASGSEQFATEFEKLGHGVFTYALIEGLKGAADSNKDLKLTVRELSTYIESKVPELSEQLKGLAQFPSAYSFGNDFPVVIYK